MLQAVGTHVADTMSCSMRAARALLLAAVLLLPSLASAQTEQPAEAPPSCEEATPVVTASPAPTPPIPPRVEGTSGVVALTFDAGADRGYAEDILDVLAEAGVPATFGMTGRWAEANPDLVERIAAEGHMVVNHTYDHRSFTGLSDRLGGLSAASRRDELSAADSIIAPLIGHTTCPWYRLPYGDSDGRVVDDVAELGYNQQVGWTIDTLGWRGMPAQAIVNRSLQLAAPNAVYVMHVGLQSRDGPALAAVITGLESMGYGFATVATLGDASSP